jgi:hypothetical protein
MAADCVPQNQEKRPSIDGRFSLAVFKLTALHKEGDLGILYPFVRAVCRPD